MEDVIEPATLLAMPYEVQQKIAIELDVESTLNLCQGATALDAAICRDDSFWLIKYRRDFGPEKVKRSQSWFENYRYVALGRATEIANIRVYEKRGPGGRLEALEDLGHLEVEINLFHRDLLTDGVYKTSSFVLPGYIVENAEIILDDMENFGLEAQYLGISDDRSIHVQENSENRNVVNLSYGGMTTYVDRTLFMTLLREIDWMNRRGKLGSVTINADLSTTRTVTGEFHYAD